MSKCAVTTNPDLLARLSTTFMPYECTSAGPEGPITCSVISDTPDISLCAKCSSHDADQAKCLGVVYNGLPLCEFSSG